MDPTVDYDQSLKFLTKFLKKVYGKGVIVLIDDYDTPLTFSKNVTQYQTLLNFLRSFLSAALEGNGANIKRACLTGTVGVMGLRPNNLVVFPFTSPMYAGRFGFSID